MAPDAGTVLQRGRHVEEPLVVFLPGVEKDEVEGAGNLRDLLERVSRNDLDDVGQPGTLDVCGELLRPLRIVFDRHQAAARVPKAHERGAHNRGVPRGCNSFG